MKLRFIIAIAGLSALLNPVSGQWGSAADSLTIINNGATFGGGYVTYNFCTDGKGGVITCWCISNKVYAQRVDGSGHAKWNNGGLLVSDSTGTKVNARIADDGFGGAYVIWENYASPPFFLQGQRLDSSGNFLWQTGGKPLLFNVGGGTEFSVSDAYIVNNNNKGAYIAAEEDITGGYNGLAAERIDLNGKPLWDSAGIAFTAIADYRQPHIIADGYGGMVSMYWTDIATTNSIFLQRFDSTGRKCFPGANGLPMNTEVSIQFPTYNLTLDSAKNILAVWDAYESQGVYTQKVDSGGNFLWGSHEVTVCDTTIGAPNYPDIIPDGLNGAYIAWSDGRVPAHSPRIYAQRINAVGQPAWQRNGIWIDTLPTYNPNPSLAPDVNHGVRVFWPSIDTNYHVQMQRLDTSGNFICTPALGRRVTPFNCATDLYGNRSVLHNANGTDILLGFDNYALYAKLIPAGCDFPSAYSACDSLHNNFTYSASADTVQFTSLASASGGSINSWYWNFGEAVSGIKDTSTYQDPEHVYDTAGNYNVCLTVVGGLSGNTCTDTFCQQITVTRATPVYAACDSLHNSFTYHLYGDSVSFTNSSTVSGGTINSTLWGFGNALQGITDTSSSLNPSHIYTSAGTYEVCLILTGGNIEHVCTDTTCQSVIISPNGIENLASSNLSIYPQPARNYLNIDYSGGEAELSSELYDVNGRKVNQFKVMNGKNIIDTAKLPSGIYYVRLMATDGSILRSEKITIE